jgi:hypothetical protein
MSRRKTLNRGGRPSKFTTAAVVKIISELLNGERIESATRTAGVGPSTLYRWMAKSKAGDPRFGPINVVFDQAKELGPLSGVFLQKLIKTSL